MEKDIPKGLQKLQAEKRNNTLHIIQEAIDEMKETGEVVTKKRLYEMTGLSPATFSKPHVKALLEKNQVCQYRPRSRSDEDIKTHIEKHRAAEFDKKEKEISRLKQELAKQQMKYDALNNDFTALNEKYQRILGECHELQRKCRSHGLF